MTKRVRIVTLIAVLLFAGVAFADTVLRMDWLFNGAAIYSPTLIRDPQNGLYKMWYGGWQDTNVNQGHDFIYYRDSADNYNWSGFVIVLEPWQVTSNAMHVNDPSVTKHFNTSNGQWQYTMFYTLCVSPCSQSQNEIWSSTGADGIHWYNHQLLLSGPLGPAEPAAIIDPQPDGTFWKVYYADRGDDTKMKMASVNGNRTATKVQVVFTSPGGQVISSPEVRNVNGVWDLWFNVHFANEVDIYKTTSNVNTSWPSSDEVLIQNSGPTYCASLTPGVLPESNGQYDMYFGLTSRQSNGGCLFQFTPGIVKWLWQQ
jgi:hypothetical protein